MDEERRRSVGYQPQVILSSGAALAVARGIVTYLTVVTDPDDYVFWDGFHPTQRVHLIAAEFIYRSIIAQSRIGALAFANWP